MDIISITSLLDPGLHKVETDLRDDLEPTFSCLDALRSSNALRWGIQRKVRYIQNRKVKDVKRRMSFGGDSASEITKVGGSPKQGLAENKVEKRLNQLRGGKRKRDGGSGSKKMKLRKILQSRWSVKRCESAKKDLYHVVREMDATCHKPVLRHVLREKARKYIGDTGLLDHLLKHMAGEVFAGGNDRLVRRHNSEGAIEYWLEPAELAFLRKKAGITDPYWVPPLGWKPGDAISNQMCDGQCKEDIKLLRSQIEELKKTENAQQEKYLNLQVQIEEHKKTENAQQEKYLDLQLQYEKLKGQFSSMQEEENGKQVAAGDEAGTKENTPRNSEFSICRQQGAFVLPKMVSSGGQYSTHSVSFDMALPPQLIVSPSPTSPPPSFLGQQQPDSQRSIPSPSSSLPQSQAVLGWSATQGTIYRPTAIYPLEGKKKAGGCSQVQCNALASAVLPRMNSYYNRADDLVTDLSLASIKY